MMRDTGSASSVAIILILASCVMLAAFFAAVVYPIHLQEAAEAEIQTALSACADTRFLMTAASSYPDVEISVPLPSGSLAAEDCGILYFNGEPIPVTRLTLTGNAGFVGISANGVWRADAGGAAWNLFPQYQRNRTCLTLEIMTFENDLSFASTEMIPLRFSYLGSETFTYNGKTATLQFVSEDEYESRLWQTYFQELVFLLDQLSKQKSTIQGELSGNMLTLTAKLYTITIQITEYRFKVYAGEER